MASRLLQNALLLDTETTGLTRGSGIHELAIYDLETQALHEVYVRPNAVVTTTNPLQEHTKLASSPMDVHVGITRPRWMDILRAQLHMDGLISRQADDAQVMRALEHQNPFLYRAIKHGKHPHLEGRLDPLYLRERERVLAMRDNVSVAVASESAISDVLAEGGVLHTALRGSKHRQGRTVWIANAAFEAKQIGAQLGALGADYIDPIKSMLETQSASPDPFYVTGKEVNQARVTAQMTGDWTGVWRAYNRYTPKAGEVAVRDIQDVLRSMTSYARKIGLTNIDDPYFGTSMDLTHRLFGSLDPDVKTAISKLTTPEVHKAAEDLVITETEVLNKAVHYTTALQQVAENTPAGRFYMEQAARGEGPIADVSNYYARLETLRPEIQRVNLIKRLARAQEDFLVQGQTYQRGAGRFVGMRQRTPDGREVRVPRLGYDRVAYSDWDGLISYLKEENRYGDLDIAGEVAAIKDKVSVGKTLAEKRMALNTYLEQEASTLVEKKIQASADVLLTAQNKHFGSVVSRWKTPGKMIGLAADALAQIKPTARMGAFGAFAGGVTGLGIAWNISQGNKIQEKKAPSVVSFSYDEWLAHQQNQQHQDDFYNTRGVDTHMEGLGHGGLTGFTRSQVTDFGSPYRGIQGSQLVFADQELLEERERWTRQQYSRVHFDPQVGLMGALGPFKSALPRGYNFINGGTPVDPNVYQSLHNSHKLLELDLSDGNWKIDVDDVDTIVVQRGGVRSALQSFFGLNKRYSFRLEGIDSTEVTHGAFSSDGGQYHAPQPFARESAHAMQQMLSGQKLKLLYNPTDSSYGRQLAVLYANGKNMNVEAVRQGYAAFLPYNKREEAIIDWKMLEQAQAGAMGSGKGMWSQPWAQVYGEFFKAGHNSITFNTFTRKEKIVKNRTTMDLLSLMEQAQSQGFMSTAQAQEAARLAGDFNSYGDERTIRPTLFDQQPSHYEMYLGDMLRSVGNWNQTHGTGYNQNKFSTKGNYGKLDHRMALDSLGSTNSVWNRRRMRAFEQYDTGEKRRERKAFQAAMQRQANHQMFNSPINHSVM